MEQKHIRVFHTYRARSLAGPIAPGVYSVGDPRLFGRAQYLVAHGHAGFFDPGEEPGEAPLPPPALDEDAGVEVIDVSGSTIRAVKAWVEEYLAREGAGPGEARETLAALLDTERKGENRRGLAGFLEARLADYETD